MEWLNIGTLPDCKAKTICWRRCSAELCLAPPLKVISHSSIIACAREIHAILTLQNNTLKTTSLNANFTSKSKAKSVHRRMCDFIYYAKKKSCRKMFNDVKLQQVHSCYIQRCTTLLARVTSKIFIIEMKQARCKKKITGSIIILTSKKSDHPRLATIGYLQSVGKSIFLAECVGRAPYIRYNISRATLHLLFIYINTIFLVKNVSFLNQTLR